MKGGRCGSSSAGETCNSRGAAGRARAGQGERHPSSPSAQAVPQGSPLRPMTQLTSASGSSDRETRARPRRSQPETTVSRPDAPGFPQRRSRNPEPGSTLCSLLGRLLPARAGVTSKSERLCRLLCPARCRVPRGPPRGPRRPGVWGASWAETRAPGVADAGVSCASAPRLPGLSITEVDAPLSLRRPSPRVFLFLFAPALSLPRGGHPTPGGGQRCGRDQPSLLWTRF